MEHKKYYFVLFSAIHAEIAHPELAINLVWWVLESEAVQTKIQGLCLKARACQYCEGLKSSWVVTQLKFKQEYKLTEKQGFVALEILNPNQKCYRSEKKY